MKNNHYRLIFVFLCMFLFLSELISYEKADTILKVNAVFSYSNNSNTSDWKAMSYDLNYLSYQNYGFFMRYENAQRFYKNDNSFALGFSKYKSRGDLDIGFLYTNTPKSDFLQKQGYQMEVNKKINSVVFNSVFRKSIYAHSRVNQFKLGFDYYPKSAFWYLIRGNMDLDKTNYAYSQQIGLNYYTESFALFNNIAFGNEINTDSFFNKRLSFYNLSSRIQLSHNSNYKINVLLSYYKNEQNQRRFENGLGIEFNY